MKHILFVTAALVLVASSAQAMAINGGAPRQPISDVASVLESPVDDYPFIIKGEIIKNIGGEKYEFRDATAIIQAEIDKEDLYNITVEGAKVTLTGEVDIEGKVVELDVDHVAKAE